MIQKNTDIHIRVSEKDKKALQRYAKRAGLSLSAYLLMSGMNQPIHAKPSKDGLVQTGHQEIGGERKPRTLCIALQGFLVFLTDADMDVCILLYHILFLLSLCVWGYRGMSPFRL